MADKAEEFMEIFNNILLTHEHLTKITIEGTKTNIVIEKPKDDE